MHCAGTGPFGCNIRQNVSIGGLLMNIADLAHEQGSGNVYKSKAFPKGRVLVLARSGALYAKKDGTSEKFDLAKDSASKNFRAADFVIVGNIPLHETIADGVKRILK